MPRIRSSATPITCVPSSLLFIGDATIAGQFYRKHRWHGMHVSGVLEEPALNLLTQAGSTRPLYVGLCLGFLFPQRTPRSAEASVILEGFLIELIAPALALGVWDPVPRPPDGGSASAFNSISFMRWLALHPSWIGENGFRVPRRSQHSRRTELESEEKKN